MEPTTTFHALDAELSAAGEARDAVSLDIHAAPCGLCKGVGAVVVWHEPGEAAEFVPAFDEYSPGQTPCPRCADLEDYR